MDLHLNDDARRDDQPGRNDGSLRLHDDRLDVAEGQGGAHPTRLRELREAVFDIADFRAIAAFAGIRRESMQEN